MKPKIDKKALRDARELALAKRQLALPVKRYGVIYADPPWRFEPYSRETGMDRAADNHYPTLDAEDIANLNIYGIAAKDSVLFLWATAPMLLEAVDVMAHWGFDYKSHLVWVKDKTGTGYWFRSAHELLLVGTRGAIPAPAPGTQSGSVLYARRGKHSVKPVQIIEMIEGLYPNLPKIELFGRGKPRKGWDAYGNEVEE